MNELEVAVDRNPLGVLLFASSALVALVTTAFRIRMYLTGPKDVQPAPPRWVRR